MKKFLAILLSMIIAVTALAACGGNGGGETTGKEGGEAQTSATEKDETDTRRDINGLKLPLTEEKKELTVWFLFNGDPATDVSQIKGVQKIEEATGVHINWIPIGMEEIGEKMGTMIANGDYPDIIFPGPSGYPGGIEKGIEDGVIREDMDELIRNNMPNYMKLLEASEEAKRQATSDNGKLNAVWSIMCYGDEVKGQGQYAGIAYRKDLLEKLGMDEPTTIDGWHEVLKKSLDEGLVEYPLNLETNGGSDLSLAFGVQTMKVGGFYIQVEDGKIVFGPAKDGFKDYLDTMKTWYSEGLINPNFTSFNFYLDTPGSVEVDQCMMYSHVISNFTGNSYFNMHRVTNENAFLEPILAPKIQEGDKTAICFNHVIAKEPTFISTNCKDPVLAAQWLDYMYTQEASYFNWFGIEGETYEIVDGLPHYMDSVFNQEGKSADDVLKQYALDKSTWIGLNDFNSELRLNEKQNAGGTDFNYNAQTVWDAGEVNYALPLVTLTSDEGAAANRKMTDLNTLVEEYMVKYITGQQVDDFETFRNNLKSYGMDDVVSIYQDALDRFNAR